MHLFRFLLPFSLAMSSSNKPADETSARLNRWYERWEENKLGWHESDVHEALKKYGDRILGQTKSEDDQVCTTPTRVFVPLCGKTVDMAFLAKQPNVSVVGVDGIMKALETFASEQPDLEIQPATATEKHERLLGKDIMLLKGDFFELDEEATGGRFEAIFDRASMVAIDPSLREAYVEIISKVIQPGGKVLLVTIERCSGTEEDKNGPPFSISEEEVRRLYESQDWVESVTLLQEGGEEARNQGTSMASLFFLIQAKMSDLKIRERI